MILKIVALVSLFYSFILVCDVDSHGVLKIPKPREEPGSGDWHYCRFFVNQYYLRSIKKT
jgi:hypothetical protein